MLKIGAMLGEIVPSLFKKPATDLYPFERNPAPERLRGRLVWNVDNCVGCNMCMKDCPTDAIKIYTVDKKNKRFVMRYYTDRCIFCSQCVQNCRFDALEMSNTDWELATLDREAYVDYYGTPEDIQIVLEENAKEHADR